MFNNKSYIQLKCKNCSNTFLSDITNKPYTLKDIAFRDTDAGKRFWRDKYKCPKCGEYTPPKVLIFDVGNDFEKPEFIKQSDIDNIQK